MLADLVFGESPLPGLQMDALHDRERERESVLYGVSSHTDSNPIRSRLCLYDLI